MDLTAFRAAVDGYRRPTGHTQRELAAALGLHPKVLSHKLHGSDGAMLRHEDIKGIVRMLAAWAAMTTRSQAIDLLELMDLRPGSFSTVEWSTPPLAELDAADASASASYQLMRTATRRPSALRLPAELTPLVGRGDEVQHILEVLGGAARLVTLTGTGGTGKTRLALAAAALAQTAGATVCLVVLSAIRDPELVPGAIASELGLQEPSGGGRRIDEVLFEHLRDLQLLLVLDNLEQVLGASSLITALLRAAPEVRVLATSRVPLRVYGEHEIRVSPLRLPPSDASVQEVFAAEAVQLFVQRARAARADVRLDAVQAALLHEICARLDGLPLAIELAAARTRQLSLRLLVERLAHPLELLDSGPRDAPARQRTLRAALEWSYDLLPNGRQRLFEKLGIFVGGCTLEAARAVCGDATDDTENGLWELVDNALLEVSNGGDPDGLPAEPRFRMLETVREYALARLAASGESEATGARHLDWCLALAEQVEPEWVDPAHVVRLEREHDNVRAALRWTIEHTDVSSGLRLAISGGHPFWYLRGRYAEGRAWLTELLALGGAVDEPALRATGLVCAGQLAYCEGATADAEALLQQSLTLAEPVGNGRAIANAEQILGNAKRGRGDLAAARRHYERARAIAQSEGRVATESFVMWCLILTSIDEGDDAGLRSVIAHFDEHLASHDHAILRARMPVIRGWLAAVDGDASAARVLLEVGLTSIQQQADSQGLVYARRLAAYCALDRCDWTDAARHLSDMLRLGTATNDRAAVARALDAVGELLAGTGQPARAVGLSGSAKALRDELGGRLVPLDSRRLDRWLRLAMLVLGTHGEAADAAGPARPLAAAIEDASTACTTLLAGQVKQVF